MGWSFPLLAAMGTSRSRLVLLLACSSLLHVPLLTVDNNLVLVEATPASTVVAEGETNSRKRRREDSESFSADAVAASIAAATFAANGLEDEGEFTDLAGEPLVTREEAQFLEKEAAEMPLLRLSGMTDNVKLFSSLVAGEDVIFLDSEHRPWVEGLTPGDAEVAEANAALNAHPSPVQEPEYAPHLKRYREGDRPPVPFKSKLRGRHTYVVPFAQRQALSWWQHEALPWTEGSGERVAHRLGSEKGGPADPKRSRLPSAMFVSDVSEVFDMTGFGNSAFYHPEAFAEQLQCGGFYSTVPYLKKPLSPLGAVCSLQHLTNFAEKVGRLLSSRTEGGGPAAETAETEAAALGAVGEIAGLSDFVKGSTEGDGDAMPNANDFENLNAPSMDELKDALGVAKGRRKWWEDFLASTADKISDRRYVFNLLMQLKGKVWKDVKASEEIFLPNVVVNALQRSGGPQPILMALSSTLLNCRAHVLYNERRTVGLPTVPVERRPVSPLVAFFNEKKATVDIPLEMEVPQRVYVDGRHYEGNTRRRRVNLLYFRSILVLWQFAFMAYRVDEQREDYERKPLDKVLFKHWILTYLGKIMLTERAPMHAEGDLLTVGGAAALEKFKMKVVKTRGKGSTVVYENDEPLTFRTPFVLDWKRRQLLPFTGSETNEQGEPSTPKLTEGQQIVMDTILREASPDQCDRDATYLVAKPSPELFRWDRVGSRGSSASASASSAASGEGASSGEGAASAPPSLVLHVDDEVGFGPEDRDHRKPIENVTTSIPVHRVDTVWTFKGTSEPRQWTINTMALGVRDPFFSPTAVLHSGLNFLFHQAIRRPLTRYINEVKLLLRRRPPIKKPLVVAFTGHSQGGAMAVYGTWFVSKHLREEIRAGSVVIYCVSFSAPMIGDKAAVAELHRHGAKYQHIVLDADPVPLLRASRGKVFMHQDAEHTIVIPFHSFARANVFSRVDGKLFYSGMSWLSPAFSSTSSFERFRLFFSRLTGLHTISKLTSSMALIWSHLHALPCAFTLLGDMLEEAGWGSFCSSPFLKDWPVRPYITSPEFDMALEAAWKKSVPSVVARVQKKIEENPLYLVAAAAAVERAYMADAEGETFARETASA
ncbi:hypothetical protein Emed_006430 [Eimeria media]